MRLRNGAAAALVTVSAVAATAAWTATAEAVDVRCGALRGTAVFKIEGERVRCPEARTIARLHARSVARRGACAFRLRDRVCTVRRYRCSFRVGFRGRPRDAFVLCLVPRRPFKVQFLYDGRKVRLPPPAGGAG